MGSMFMYASSFNQDIKKKVVSRRNGSTYNAWDVSKAGIMNQMFMYASSFNINISNWPVSNNVNVVKMFDNAKKMENCNKPGQTPC